MIYIILQVPDPLVIERPLVVNLDGRSITVAKTNLASQPPFTGTSIYNLVSTIGKCSLIQEPTESSKQPIRAGHLGHVTGYQPIRDQYFLMFTNLVFWFSPLT